MAAKRIQVSVDAGTTYRTLPGNSGEFNEEEATVTDTVFGQSFESNDVSIGQWEVSANGFFKGAVGYCAKIRQTGVATTMTTEATTLVSGKTYQITATAKRIIDYFTAVTVFDNAVDRTANVISIDYLAGTVTFAGAYTVVGPVTITGKYLPTAVIANIRNFTLTQNTNAIDTSDFETACGNNGWRTFKPGLRTVQFETDGLYNYTNGTAAALRARAPIIIEVTPDNSTTTVFRGFFKRQNRGQSGDVGALETEKQAFGLWVPDGSLVVTPFSWYFGSGAAINLAMKDVITAWQAETLLKVRYQDDNAVVNSGHVGDAVTTEITLTGSYEGLNEFKFGFRGSGAPATV
jgi:hypothetical protein